MQYDFGSLPSSCMNNKDDTARSSSAAANESPKRSKRIKSMPVANNNNTTANAALFGDDDEDKITWQSSSSPAHYQFYNQTNSTVHPGSSTGIAHLRDIAGSLIRGDPAAELRAKFESTRTFDGLTRSSAKKKNNMAGRIGSMPAIKNNDMGTMIGKMLDNLDDDDDDEEEEREKQQSAKSLPSSPVAPVASVASDSEGSEPDWAQIDEAVEKNVSRDKKVEEMLEDLSDLSDFDEIKKETGEEDSEDDLDLSVLDRQVASKKASEQRATFRTDGAVKQREEDKEVLESDIKRRDLWRLIVITVQEDEDELVIECEHKDGAKFVHARDVWCHTKPPVGAVIHVIGAFPKQAKSVVVDDKQNLLIIHPDTLITATNVADSFYCERKIVLREHIRQPGGSQTTKQMLYGDLVHALFEMCLEQKRFVREEMREAMQEMVKNQFFESIILLDLCTDQVMKDMEEKIGQLIKFKNRYLQPKPHAASKVEVHRMNTTGYTCVSNVIDTEEQIWSPVFGLQGKIDATVESVVKDEANGTLHKHLVPMELKTAQFNRTVGHRAQTTLYTLMLADRYGIDVKFGLLFYSETCDLHRIPLFHDEVGALLAQRNHLAIFIKSRKQLPEPLKDDRRCVTCNQQAECMIMHKMVEQGTAETAGTDDMFFNQTDHLTQNQIDFFRHWDWLMDKEGMEGTKFRKEIWTMSSKAREQVGRCFGNLRIKPSHDGVKAIGRGWNRYVLERVPSSNTSSNKLAQTDSQLVPNDRIIVSDESGHICLATGIVHSINSREIEIGVDRRLDNAMMQKEGFDAESNQSFVPRYSNELGAKGAQVFRIDQDSFEKSMGLARGNLMRMFTVDEDPTLRRLVVDLEPPKFFDTPMEYTALETKNDEAKFNADQLNAVNMVMRAQNYALILGMPGTGKTTTIAGIIEALVNQGKSVLLTSFTHSAVDNICLKIRDRGFGVCRISRVVSRVHPLCQDLVPTIHEGDKLTKEAMEKKYLEPPVIATTCLSLNHWLFGQRKFDYCIVDEASQLTLPVCLGPLLMAEKFLLVGDHYQLQPVVKNAEAVTGGFKQSLFERLSIANPQASVNLAHQYRMCRDVMLLSNELVYEGKLECGSEQVANQTLKIPRPNRIIELKKTPGMGWMEHVVNEANRVIFLNTDEIEGAEESVIGSRIQNKTEAEIIHQMVELFCEAGVAETQIGLITVYRSQLRLLNQVIKPRTGIEALTADRFQGRDKDCIIISLVRNNTEGIIGELLNDWRRLNVSFTRAKSKLIFVGSRKTLDRDPRLTMFLSLIDERNWCYQLPGNCTDMYTCPPTFQTPTSIMRITQRPANSQPPSPSPSPSKHKTPKRNVAGERVMENNPIVRDIINDLK